MPIQNELKIARPDDFYASLVNLHNGCDVNESLRRWSRLVLLLANHIGEEAVLSEAVAAAANDRKP